jgi:hypothetical protein
MEHQRRSKRCRSIDCDPPESDEGEKQSLRQKTCANELAGRRIGTESSIVWRENGALTEMLTSVLNSLSKRSSIKEQDFPGSPRAIGLADKEVNAPGDQFLETPSFIRDALGTTTSRKKSADMAEDKTLGDSSVSKAERKILQDLSSVLIQKEFSRDPSANLNEKAFLLKMLEGLVQEKVNTLVRETLSSDLQILFHQVVKELRSMNHEIRALRKDLLQLDPANPSRGNQESESDEDVKPEGCENSREDMATDRSHMVRMYYPSKMDVWVFLRTLFDVDTTNMTAPDLVISTIHQNWPGRVRLNIVSQNLDETLLGFYPGDVSIENPHEIREIRYLLVEFFNASLKGRYAWVSWKHLKPLELMLGTQSSSRLRRSKGLETAMDHAKHYLSLRNKSTAIDGKRAPALAETCSEIEYGANTDGQTQPGDLIFTV